jgi:hypothetical protein
MERPDSGLNRRTFLKQFALISSVPLLIQSLSGCPVAVMYGPASINNTSPEVEGMYIHEPQSGSGILDGKTDVPVDAGFEVEFTEQVDSSSLDSIHLRSDEDNLEIISDTVWLTPRIAVITPVAPLRHSLPYTLFVEESARDDDGNTIGLTQGSSASFVTA